MLWHSMDFSAKPDVCCFPCCEFGWNNYTDLDTMIKNKLTEAERTRHLCHRNPTIFHVKMYKRINACEKLVCVHAD